MVENGECLYCGVSFERATARQRFCCDAHRLRAWRQKRRVENRLPVYTLSAEQLHDLRDVKKVSHEAANTIAKVASVAGKELAGDVLDAVWDVMINMGYRVEVMS